MTEHQFTSTILTLLKEEFAGDAAAVFAASPLLGYINLKTKAASRGSKSRASFGNLYAIYVLVEDYLKGGFDKSGKYSLLEPVYGSTLPTRRPIES
ncbi:MAG: hypothetical protein QM770_10840 [Tepidisphaeraceae bacterium]